MDKGKKRDTNLSASIYSDIESGHHALNNLDKPENTIPPVSHTLSVGRSAYSQHMSDANSRYLSSPPTPNSARSSRSLDDINSLASLARNPSTQSPSTRRSHPRRRMVSGIPVRKGSSLHRHSGGRPPTINRVTSGVPQSSSRIANQHLYSADRGPSMNQNYPRSPTVTRYITGTSSAVPSIPIQKSSNIYYRHLSAKARGSPLWIPEPNNYLNVLYRRRGIAIGDVGIITDDGAFDFLFNICLPKNDPMNSGGVPDYYSPLHPPLLPARDIRGHQELGENTYLASEAIKKEISDVGPSGITFIASACEGAILTIPQGAYTENLANTARFNEYLERNVLNWYRYANGICGRQIENGDLRLVIGADKSRAWGMATFANFTEQANVPLKLRFKPSNDSRVGRIYTWDYSGVADSARSGPGRREIEALWTGDEGEEMHVFENQSLFVRTLNAKLQEDQWEKLESELRTSSIRTDPGPDFEDSPDPNATSGPLPKASSSAPNETSSVYHKSPVSRYGYIPLSLTTENFVDISDVPTSLKFHPSSVINDFLLQTKPDAWIAITEDWDWISILKQDDSSLPASGEILARLLTTHEVTNTNGVASLTPKVPLESASVGTADEHTTATTSGSFKSEAVDQLRSDMEEREFGRRPGQAPSIASDSTTTVSAAPAQSTTATSAVIIPNKSTMEEEHIDIPYGREGHDSGVTTIDDRAGDTGRDIDGDTEPPDSASEYANPTMPRNPPAGRMGLSARLKGAEDDDDAVPGNRSGDNLYDKYGRSSVDSTRSAGGNGMGSRLINGRVSTSEDTEKMRRDYEYKIATMQTQVTTLERDLDDAAENEKRRKESEARVRQLDEELAGLLQRAEEQSLAMRSMQKELEDLKEARQREARQAQDDREELIIFRDRCNKLEEENELRQGAADSENVDQLRSAMEDLVMEISELSRRNDELMTSKESDNVLIRDMDNQLKEYKRKYEQAKTELRSPLITDDLFSLWSDMPVTFHSVDEWNAHFANMAKSTEPTFTDNAPKQVVTVPELPCVTSSTTNIQPTYNTAATMPAKDWDLSNLLLAQMGYVQTNPGSNFNQQFDTPIPSYIPGTTMPQMGTGNTAYATTPKIVNSGYAPAVKATSQLFLQAPKFDRGEDQLPMAPDGGVLDIHITAFLSAVDSFLTAGRSNALTRVLTPMKSVINVVTNIIEDVKAFERRPVRDRADVDADSLRSLRDRAEATLSNLVAATKIHASSSGMSPVSLLDAAASHVSVTITEIGRTICIRKATKAEQEQYAYTTYAGPPASALDGFSPSLRSVEETRSGHQRKASQASPSSRGGQFFFKSPSSPLNNQSWSYMDNRRRPPSDNSSSVQTNSPPPIFDTHSNLESVMSDDSVQAEGPEDAWAELKPYLEAQTESIVYAIQSALSGVRSPTPSPTLNENLTQIITIVSSIVAVCNDNLPPASAQQGNEILRELSDHANKLSEVQALPEVTKESRQIMAKSSFAIANAMKGLMKL